MFLFLSLIISITSLYEWSILGGPHYIPRSQQFHQCQSLLTSTSTTTCSSSTNGNWPGIRSSMIIESYKLDGMIMFGGEMIHPDMINGKVEYYNDLWLYNYTRKCWVLMNGGVERNDNGTYGLKGQFVNESLPRSRSGMGSWLKNENNLMIFGGESENGYYLNDLWEYDMDLGKWRWIFMESKLGKRSGMIGMSGRNKNNEMMIFSGKYKDYQCYNDLWIFDYLQEEWIIEFGSNETNVKGGYYLLDMYDINNIPTSRFYSIGWRISDEIVIVFGGSTYISTNVHKLNDMFVRNFTSKLWKWKMGDNITNTVENFITKEQYDVRNYPPAISGGYGMFFTTSNELAFFGGFLSPNTPSNQMWFYNLNSSEWKIPKIGGFFEGFYEEDGEFCSTCVPYPIGLIAGSKIIIDGRESYLMFGGNDNSLASSELWELKDVHRCNDVIEFDQNQVCSKRGKCLSSLICECNDPKYYGDYCQFTTCKGIDSSEPNTCSGKGECIDYNVCQCNSSYGGGECEIPKCFGLTNEKACSGKGECKLVDYCTCESLYYGDECESSYVVAVTVIPITIGVIIFVLIVIVIVLLIVMILCKTKFKVLTKNDYEVLADGEDVNELRKTLNIQNEEITSLKSKLRESQRKLQDFADLKNYLKEIPDKFKEDNKKPEENITMKDVEEEMRIEESKTKVKEEEKI